MTFFSRPLIVTGASSSMNFPASILDRSRMSLMMPRRCWLAEVDLVEAVCLLWCHAFPPQDVGGHAEDAVHRRPYSWLMLARKALLATLAASAASLLFRQFGGAGDDQFFEMIAVLFEFIPRLSCARLCQS